MGFNNIQKKEIKDKHDIIIKSDGNQNLFTTIPPIIMPAADVKFEIKDQFE